MDLHACACRCRTRLIGEQPCWDPAPLLLLQNWVPSRNSSCTWTMKPATSRGTGPAAIYCTSIPYRVHAHMCRAGAATAQQKSDSDGSTQSGTSRASGPAASAASASTSVPPGFLPSPGQTLSGAAGAQASLAPQPCRLSTQMHSACCTHRRARRC